MVRSLRLVASNPIIEVTLFGEPHINQQLQRAVDGRITDVGMAGPDSLVKVLGRNMSPGLKKSIQDGLALPGPLEMMLLQIFGQNSMFGFMGH